MPVASSVPIAAEASRPAIVARDGSARPSEAGFSDQLAQALAMPAPDGAAPPSFRPPQAAAEQSGPTPLTAAPAPGPVAAPALAADFAPVLAADPAPPAPHPAGEAADTSEVEPTEAAADSDEPVADPVGTESQPDGFVQASVPQPSAAGESPASNPAPKPSPGDARPDAASAPSIAPGTPDVSAAEEPSGGDPGTQPTAPKRKLQAPGAGVAIPGSEQKARLGEAPPSVPAPLSPDKPGPQPAADTVSDEAPAPKEDEWATGRHGSPGPVADLSQVAAPPTAAPPAPMPVSGASEAATLLPVQSNAPAQAARPGVTTTDAAPAPPPPPAAQVAPAVAALVSTAPNGVQRLVVRLDPVELGQVEVRVERAEGGPAAVSLTAERPETLLLLVRDQAGLHRALDQAGVPMEGRTVQFQLSPQDPGTQGQQAALGAGGGWGGFGEGARQGRGETSRGWRHPGSDTDRTARAAWSRAGIDITA